MLPQEEIDEQLELLRTYRRTLATYLRQQAAIGEAFSPPALLYGITEARSHIQRIKSALRAAGIAVPEDIDDAEPPPIVIVPRTHSRARAGLWITSIGAAVLLVIGLALGMFGGRLLPGQESGTPRASLGAAATAPSIGAQESGTPRASLGAATTPSMGAADTTPPSPTAVAAATAAAPDNSANAAPFAEYTFADGTPDGWNGEPEQWQIVKDGEGFAYQANAPASTYTAASPPDFDRINSLQNYAVEMRLKIVQAGAPPGENPDVWLSLRGQNEPGDGCDAYNFMLWQTNHSAMISLAGSRAGCDQELAHGPLTLDIGQWHTVRAEVNDEQLKLFVDGTLVVSATNTALNHGFFYVTVGPHAIVQLADVRIYKL